MADKNKKTTGGTGENKGGRPTKQLGTWQKILQWREQEEIKGKLGKEDIRDVAMWLLSQNKEELKKVVEESNAPIIVVMFARAMLKDVSVGSLWSFNNIWDKFLADKSDKSVNIKFISGIDMGGKDVEDDENSDENEG